MGPVVQMDGRDLNSTPRSVGDLPSPDSDQVACPICGASAERGYLLARGSITWGRGVMSSFKLASGDRLTPFLAINGSLAGIRCQRCEKIIVES